MKLAKNVLALDLTAAMSAIDGSIQKKIQVKLIIEQEDMQDIIKIIKEHVRKVKQLKIQLFIGYSKNLKKKKTKFPITFSSINKYRNK